MPNFEVEYYEKADGTYPAEEFILKQPIKLRARILHCIELAKKYKADYERREE